VNARLLAAGGGERTFAAVFTTGDEVVGLLTDWAGSERLSGARLTAIGAFSSAVLGYFDWERKEYLRIPVDEQAEVLAFIGDIALKDDEPARELGMGAGRERGGLLVPGVDEADAVAVRPQRLHHAVDAVARQSEHGVHAPVDQPFDQDVGHGLRLAHDPPRPCWRNFMP
jgi:predicted DNA-binding protein with PD1-like motif